MTAQRTTATRNYVAMPAPGHDVHGIWHTFGAHNRTGYATHGMSLHWMLSKVLGIHTELVPHRFAPIDVDEIQKRAPDRYDLLFSWIKDPVGYPHVVFASYPPEVAAQSEPGTGNYVSYCAFEATRISKYGADVCNGPAFRKVWVVSQFCRRAFEAGGVVNGRIRVVRPALTSGPWTMSPIEQLREHKRRPVTHDSPFVFGVLGTWQERKGMPALVRSYFRAFNREQPVRLVIRTSQFGKYGAMTISQFKEHLTGEVAKIAEEEGDKNFRVSSRMPRISFEVGTELTDQEVIEWLGRLDAYANCSYGEGLGIPHIWAKAQGVPMVTTGFGAVGELVEEEIASREDVIVPHTLQKVDPEVLKAVLLFDRDSEWGGYDVNDYATGLKRMFDLGRGFAENGAGYVRDAFSVERCVAEVRAGLRELLDAEWIEKWQI